MSEVKRHPGVKLLYSDYNREGGKPVPPVDDRQYPFRLKLVTMPRSSRGVDQYGAMAELIFGGETREALDAFIDGEGCEDPRRKPDTIRVTLTDPSGTVLREHSK